MTDIEAPPSPLAVFRGRVACRRAGNVLTLSGSDAASADDRLILTFISPSVSDLPDSLGAATIRAVGERRYRITSTSRDLILEATSLHVHHDVGNAFYRAVPKRPAPLKKRFFWQVVLALAGTHAGKRLLLSLRRRA